MNISKKTVFVLLILASLFTIFFVGREFDASTGKRSLIITDKGISHFRKGLDVSGGTRLIYKISYDKYNKIYQGAELIAVKQLIENIILKNIDGRISKLGVSDYKAYVQKLNEQPYIVVEIGGIADLDQAKEIIGKTVELEFKLQNKEKKTAESIAERKTMAQKLFGEISANPALMKKLTEEKMSENVYYNLFSGATIDQLPEIYKKNEDVISSLEKGKIYDGLVEGVYTTIPGKKEIVINTGTDLDELGDTKLEGFTMIHVLDKTESKNASGEAITLYSIEDVFVQDKEVWVAATDKENNVLNGAYFKYANTSSSQVGEPVVVINLDDKGKEIFCNISEANIGNPMAIFVGGELLTAPNIQSKICGGTAQIDGSFTTESAKELVDALNDGALPAPLLLMQEEKISPTLGIHALTGSLRAGLIGFIAICILIFFMYGFRKMIIVALVLSAFLAVLFAFVKISDFALSLSGIAAIILAIGMGVDANILMFERFREEIKDGKSVEGAIDRAKARSWPAIKDGQISSGIIALLLFAMGINIFKGFGAMMLVCLILTLAFNVPLTQMLMHAFYDRKQD